MSFALKGTNSKSCSGSFSCSSPLELHEVNPHLSSSVPISLFHYVNSKYWSTFFFWLVYAPVQENLLPSQCEKVKVVSHSYDDLSAFISEWHSRFYHLMWTDKNDSKSIVTPAEITPVWHRGCEKYGFVSCIISKSAGHESCSFFEWTMTGSGTWHFKETQPCSRTSRDTLWGSKAADLFSVLVD